jgi:hypothetical protein
MEIGGARFLAVSAVAAEDLEVSGLRVRLDSALVSDASNLPLINNVLSEHRRIGVYLPAVAAALDRHLCYFARHVAHNRYPLSICRGSL